MSLTAPNYTQVPNEILDSLMCDMNTSELRVVLVIVRQTFGWHRKKAELSLSFLQHATGLSRQGVLNGIKAAMDRGLVSRVRAGQSWKYELIITNTEDATVENTGKQHVNKVDTKHETSQLSRPQLVNSVDHLDASTSQLSRHKERKKKKKGEKERKPTAATANNDDHSYLRGAPSAPAAAAVFSSFSEIGILSRKTIKTILESWPDIEHDDIIAWHRYRQAENNGRNGEKLGIGFLVEAMRGGIKAPDKFYQTEDDDEPVFILA